MINDIMYSILCKPFPLKTALIEFEPWIYNLSEIKKTAVVAAALLQLFVHFFNQSFFLQVDCDPYDEVDRGEGKDRIKDRGRVCEPPQIKSHEQKVDEEDEKVQAMHEVEGALPVAEKFAAKIGQKAEAAVAETLNDFRITGSDSIDKSRYADDVHSQSDGDKGFDKGTDAHADQKRDDRIS